jgi:hypothetical protein
MQHAASTARGETVNHSLTRVNHSLTDRTDGQKWPGPAPFAVFRSRFRVQTCRIFPLARVGVRKSAAPKKATSPAARRRFVAWTVQHHLSVCRRVTV